tara:strand:- start:2016 stop:2291 length:276 start_codon:yes stop_codon:yes gene_type:complete
MDKILKQILLTIFYMVLFAGSISSIIILYKKLTQKDKYKLYNETSTSSNNNENKLEKKEDSYENYYDYKKNISKKKCQNPEDCGCGVKRLI